MGFSTARQHMEAVPVVKEESKPVAQNKPTTSNKKVGAAPPGQETLSRYFGIKGQQPQNTRTPIAEAGLDDGRQSPKTIHRNRPGAPCLTGNSIGSGGYRVQSQQRQPQRAVPLAVADANNYNWLPTEKASVAASETNETGGLKGQRPATTFHKATTTTMMAATTTMSMPTTMDRLKSNGGINGRKTLGVRRSLNNGWAERMSRANQQNGG